MDDQYGTSAPVRKHLTPYSAFDNYRFELVRTGSHATIRDKPILQPHFNHMRFVTLPKANTHQSADGICAHFMVHGFNRVQKAPIGVGLFDPDTRRLILGTDNGEFSLWESETFKFEKLITASRFGIRAMAFKKSGGVLIMGDQGGFIHYYNNSLKLVYSTNAHEGTSLRGIAIAPGDLKFVSCGDNAAVKIWDWLKGTPELTLSEHHSDVRCVDWHPYRGLIASGSKDNSVKFWDPRQPQSLATLFSHKNTVLCCKFNPINGNWLATGSRDTCVKIFDIRVMKEITEYKGHNKEVCSMAWHPIHEDILVTGGFQGSMIYWHMGFEGPHTIIANAHNYSVNMLCWHPVGHCLTSAANDGILKVWGREPPGSTLTHYTSEYQDPLRVEYGPLPSDHKSSIPEASTSSSGDGGHGGRGHKERTHGQRQQCQQLRQAPPPPPIVNIQPAVSSRVEAVEVKVEGTRRVKSRFN